VSRQPIKGQEGGAPRAKGICNAPPAPSGELGRPARRGAVPSRHAGPYRGKGLDGFTLPGGPPIEISLALSKLTTL
jgi:hypothetical protein